MAPFHGHIDRKTYERLLREACDRLAATATGEALECQMRGSETVIQFDLWVADELNAGTEPRTLMIAGSAVLGTMLEHFARGFGIFGSEGDATSIIIDDILARMRWQTTDDSSDLVAEIQRPMTKAGSA